MNVSSGPGGGGGFRGKPSSASPAGAGVDVELEVTVGSGDGTAGLAGADSVLLLADAAVAGGWSSSAHGGKEEPSVSRIEMVPI